MKRVIPGTNVAESSCDQYLDRLVFNIAATSNSLAFAFGLEDVPK